MSQCQLGKINGHRRYLHSDTKYPKTVVDPVETFMNASNATSEQTTKDQMGNFLLFVKDRK